jgi:hypothetical protein
LKKNFGKNSAVIKTIKVDKTVCISKFKNQKNDIKEIDSHQQITHEKTIDHNAILLPISIMQ